MALNCRLQIKTAPLVTAVGTVTAQQTTAHLSGSQQTRQAGLIATHPVCDTLQDERALTLCICGKHKKRAKHSCPLQSELQSGKGFAFS